MYKDTDNYRISKYFLVQKKAKKNLVFAKNEMTSDNHNKFKILLKQWITTTESDYVCLNFCVKNLIKTFNFLFW